LSSVSNATGNFLTISGGVVHQRTPSETRSDVGAQAQLNGTGFVKASGTTISYDNSTYQVTSEKGQPNGYASLDSNGKVPLVQINDALIGNVNFQGLWNAATNTPTLANPPASGTKGYYYIVSTAGTFASISFEVGDWIISDGTAWGKVDNTDAVSSVFGRTGNVVAANGDYTTAQVTESGNLYYTDGRARGALSFVAGSGAYNSTTGVITIPTNNNQITNGAGYITSAALSGYLPLTGGTLTGQLSSTFKSSIGALLLNSGDVTDAINNRVQISLGYDGSSTYKHYITTTHNDGTPVQNRIRFYTSDGLSNGTFPTNAILGLSIENGSISTGGITASGNITGANLSGTNTGNVTISTANGLSLSGQALSLGLASGSANGALSSTDWTTFNNKQAAGNYVTLDTAQTITESKTFSKINSAGSGDYTNMTSFPIRITGTSGPSGDYWRIPFLSNSSTISGVFNFQTGKSVYWGEPDDTGTYFFRGRSFSATSAVFSGNIGVSGASATYPLTVYNASNATTAAFGGTARGLRVDNDGVNSVGMTTLFGVDNTFYGSYQPIRLSGSTVHLAIGTSNVLTVTAGGNVGINTASPESLSNNTTLQIDGTNHSFVRTGTSNYGGYFATIPTAEVLCIANVRNPVTGTYNNTGKAASGINLFSQSSNGYIEFLTTATNNSGPSTRMTITSGGNVLIGATTALNSNAKLQVTQAASGVSNFWVNADDVIIESSANVGITFATPNTARATIAFTDPQSTVAGFIFYDHAQNYMSFGTSDSERIAIASSGLVTIQRDLNVNETTLLARNSGNVGIRNTSPQAYLDIGGVADSAGFNNLVLRSGNSDDASPESNQILFGYANSMNYAHAIKTRHQSGSQAGNSIEFWVWKVGDPIATQAGQRAMIVEGNQTTFNGEIKTGALDGGYVAGNWKLGRALTGSQPSETHQIIVEINGALFSIGAASI
jgi:hypothetical protein